MKAIWNDTVIAESDQTILIEGNHYFPASSVDMQFLKPSTHTTLCPWKGEAHYYTVVVGDTINEHAAWYYPFPKEGSVERVGHYFAGYLAFWKGIVVSDS